MRASSASASLSSLPRLRFLQQIDSAVDFSEPAGFLSPFLDEVPGSRAVLLPSEVGTSFSAAL